MCTRTQSPRPLEGGAGKTTAAEVILGLQRPDRGEVRVYDGTPAEAISGGQVGAMLQDADLPQGVTPAELIELIRFIRTSVPK